MSQTKYLSGLARVARLTAAQNASKARRPPSRPPSIIPSREDRGVHRAGAGPADGLDLDALIIEKRIEHASGEGAVRPSALEREIDGFWLHWGYSPRRLSQDR